MHNAHDGLQKKIVHDYKILRRIIEGYKAAGHIVVVTIGSWDMIHVGHARYLRKAKEQGDILVVGVDSDAAIRKYKGEHRPVVPQEERLEMLSYLDFVDFITLVEDVDERGHWKYHLIQQLRPQIFVAVENSYPEAQRKAIRKYCGHLEVLPRQAENTSSTDVYKKLIHNLPALMEQMDRR